jgi:hypothetical protein
MPPNEEFPNCNQKVNDWHIEWYTAEVAALYQGRAAMDCPLCGQPVGPPPPGVPLVRRSAAKAAEWSGTQAIASGGTLQGYTSSPGAGSQYAKYWTPQELLQADADEQSKKPGP